MTLSLSINLLMDTQVASMSCLLLSNAAVNIGVHVSFQIRALIFSGYLRRSGIVG